MKNVRTGTLAAIASSVVLLDATPTRAQFGPTQLAELYANDGAALDDFGFAVDLSGDAIIVGARLKSSTDAGGAYIFRLAGATITDEDALAVPGLAADDNFGMDVGISGDFAIVGAPFRSGTGAVFAFSYDTLDADWNLESIPLPPVVGEVAASDEFGRSVAIFGDMLVVGSKLGNSAEIDSGAAYVYKRVAGSWTFQQKITASNGQTGDWFGLDVAIDNNVLVVGAPARNGHEGAAYVFHFNGVNWFEAAMLTADVPAVSDDFGSTVDVSDTTVIVGAPDRNGATGSAFIYLFDFDGVTPTWTEQGELAADDGNLGHHFGSSVSLSGNVALVGSINAGGGSGAVYQYNRSGSSWIQEGFGAFGFDANAFEQTGTSVAVDGLLSVAGAPGHSHGLAQAGAAYVFELTVSTSGDTDGDGLSDDDENNIYGTDPFHDDTDGDGLLDGFEVNHASCISPLIADFDGDGRSDADEINVDATDPCDGDSDDDGLDDGEEFLRGTYPNDADSDNDGVNDGPESLLDDGFGCPNLHLFDSDGDTLSDGFEVYIGSNPCNQDFDGDLLTDANEVFFGTDPNDADSDNDSLLDGNEVDIAQSSGCPDPLDPDSDGDTLEDGDEVNNIGTSACNTDTDNDGIEDDLDPLPIEEGVTPDFLADLTGLVSQDVAQLSISEFVGPNNLTRAIRRAALALQLFVAGELIRNELINAAQALLGIAESRVDGPPDWVMNGAALKGQIDTLQFLLDAMN